MGLRSFIRSGLGEIICFKYPVEVKYLHHESSKTAKVDYKGNSQLHYRHVLSVKELTGSKIDLFVQSEMSSIHNHFNVELNK